MGETFILHVSTPIILFLAIFGRILTFNACSRTVRSSDLNLVDSEKLHGFEKWRRSKRRIRFDERCGQRENVDRYVLVRPSEYRRRKKRFAFGMSPRKHRAVSASSLVCKVRKLQFFRDKTKSKIKRKIGFTSNFFREFSAKYTFSEYVFGYFQRVFRRISEYLMAR